MRDFIHQQGSNWLMAVGAEKRGRDSERISSGGFGGRFRPWGARGRAQASQAILVFKAIFLLQRHTYPPPPPMC